MWLNFNILHAAKIEFLVETNILTRKSRRKKKKENQTHLILSIRDQLKSLELNEYR